MRNTISILLFWWSSDDGVQDVVVVVKVRIRGVHKVFVFLSSLWSSSWIVRKADCACTDTFTRPWSRRFPRPPPFLSFHHHLLLRHLEQSRKNIGLFLFCFLTPPWPILCWHFNQLTFGLHVRGPECQVVPQQLHNQSRIFIAFFWEGV